jgi:hypothetical protein
MNEQLDPRDDAIVSRLRALGTQPVDPALQSQHLTAMAGVRRSSAFRTSLAGRLKVAAGVFAGFLLGASGLATAGALGPLQPIVAEKAAEVANVELPQGPKDKAEKAEKAAKEARVKAANARLADGSLGTQRQWDGCQPTDDGTFAGNRGLYLKQERAKGAEALAAAKASVCGLPVGAEAPEAEDDAETTDTETEGRQNGDAGKSAEEHGKTTAPGQADKDDRDPGSKAQGPKDDAGKPADAGPPSTAGNSGIDPTDPVTPAEPETPAAPADGDSEDDTADTADEA